MRPKWSQIALWDPLGTTLSKTPFGDASRTRPGPPKIASSRPKDPPNPPQIAPKSIKNHLKKHIKFQDVFQMDFRAYLVPKSFIFCLFLYAFGAENHWNNENIDFREFALTLQREHRISHFFMKISSNFASKSLPNRVESLDPVFHRFYLQNDPKMTPKMVQNRPKIDKKTYLKSYRISLKIFISFLSIFGRSWSLLGAWGVWAPSTSRCHPPWPPPLPTSRWELRSVLQLHSRDRKLFCALSVIQNSKDISRFFFPIYRGA